LNSRFIQLDAFNCFEPITKLIIGIIYDESDPSDLKYHRYFDWFQLDVELLQSYQ